MTRGRRGSGVVRGCVALAAVGILAIGGTSQATTIPLPTGIVAGTQAFSSHCAPTPENCDYGVEVREFKGVKALGRISVGGRGIQIVVAATRMHYESYQYFCPFSCPPTTPALTEPFTINGTAGNRSTFSATCSAGTIGEALQDIEIGLGPIVSASCEGGTTANSGPFSFRFLLPEDLPGVNGPFAGTLVEV